MLAVYLATPEVENDRRALNVFYGMRRARKEGRWMATAPIGYVNRINEMGKKQIVLREPQASIIKWAFKEISEGKYSTEQIWKRAKELGLQCSKHNFWLAIRNPVYCGKITVPEFEDEPRHLVPGLHEPLISESLFYDVQDVLDGRKKRGNGTKIVSNSMLPLRGFLKCSRCSKTLSGSASKGRYQYYHYYHCHSSCGCRLKAEELNELFVARLKDFVLNPGAEELFKRVIVDAYSSCTQSVRESRTQFINEITEQNNRITKARELLLKGDIDGADYKIVKNEAEQKIATLEAKLVDKGTEPATISDVERIVEKAISVLVKLDVIYWKSYAEMQRKIIGSIYPEKFTFENLKDRTAILSEVFKIIFLINSGLSSKKTGQTIKI